MKRVRDAHEYLKKKLTSETRKSQLQSTIRPHGRRNPKQAGGDGESVEDAIALSADHPSSELPILHLDPASIPQPTVRSTSHPSSEAATDPSRRESAPDIATSLRTASLGQRACLTAEEHVVDSPRHSMNSHDRGASSPPSEAGLAERRRKAQPSTRELRITPIDPDQGAEHVVITPTINVRSATLPPESTESVRPDLVLLPTRYLTPRAASYTSSPRSPIRKSPAPSVSEGDLMEDIMPQRIDVKVTMTWEEIEGTWVPEKISDFPWIFPDSYDKLLPHKFLDKHQKAHQELKSKEIYFRHGSCRVRSSPGLDFETPYEILDEDRADLLREAAVQIICGFISKHPRKPFSLEVYWDAGSAQLSPLPGDDTPFLEVIRSELRKKIRLNFRRQEYIPGRDQNIFRRYNVIRDIVFHDSSIDKWTDSDKADFVKTIVQKPAGKLWMICVYSHLNMWFLWHLLHDHDCSDTAPPKKYEECKVKLCEDRILELLGSLSVFNVKPIDGGYIHSELPTTEVMPLRWTGVSAGSDSVKEELGKGASSHVYKVHIDCSHHYLSGDPWCQFALKVFPDLRRKEFEREKDMLRILADYPDDHIVRHLQSWTQEGQHCILYPKAAYNLRDFMRHYQPLDLSRPAVLWFLRQLQGLANAIKHVHNLKHPTNTDPYPDEDALWGCHYDIKPENILVFEKQPNHYPVFKISDFGVGVFHEARAPGEESFLTGTPRGTETYFGPDLKRDGKVSRPFDMWALGCVFLEFMVWLFGFFQSDDGFSTERFNCTGADLKNKDDGFWTKDIDGKYALKAVVEEALTDLSENHCVELRAFLKVIEAIKGLLQVDPKKRWPAPNLASFLEATLRQARADLEKDPTFYMDQYDANCTGNQGLRRLASERIHPDDGFGVSTRSHSLTSLERHWLSSYGRPRSDTHSSQAVIHTGSGTGYVSNFPRTDDGHLPGTGDALERELSEI